MLNFRPDDLNPELASSWSPNVIRLSLLGNCGVFPLYWKVSETLRLLLGDSIDIYGACGRSDL